MPTQGDELAAGQEGLSLSNSKFTYFLMILQVLTEL